MVVVWTRLGVCLQFLQGSYDTVFSVSKMGFGITITYIKVNKWYVFCVLRQETHYYNLRVPNDVIDIWLILDLGFVVWGIGHWYKFNTPCRTALQLYFSFLWFIHYLIHVRKTNRSWSFRTIKCKTMQNEKSRFLYIKGCSRISGENITNEKRR